MGQAGSINAHQKFSKQNEVATIKELYLHGLEKAST
jgi:hypothetical protein